MSNRLLLVLTRLAGLRAGRRHEPHAAHYHDVPGPLRYHFALRLKRPHRNRFTKMSADERHRFIACAFENDPRERLVQFLRDFGLRTLGAAGTLESLTLLEDTTDARKRGGRYLAAFGSGTRMIWTVALSTDGAVSFDGTDAPA